MTCQEVEAILNELTQSKDGNVDYLRLCASIISVANQCQYVAEGNISSIEAQKRVNSRTFTRRPESSRSKRALDKSDSPDSQCLSPYKSDSDDRLEFLSPQESYQDSLCLSSSQNDCRDTPVLLLNHQDCNKVISRGIFFVEDDGRISSHHYTLDLKEDCTVCISTKAVEVERFCEVDVEMLLFGEGASGSRSLISSTQFKDKQGVYWLEANLEKGHYWIIPFTTGCWINPIIDSKDESISLVHTNESRTITLSTAATEALKKVFENIDLDQDGLVSRNEFTLFSLRTSGEMPTDEEWSIVESNFETRSAKLTMDSFLALHEMEVQESGDTGSLNQTLKLMGYNSDLQLDKAAPFSLSVYTVSSIVSLTPCPVMVDSELINKALCRLAVEKGTAIKVKNLNDLSLHQHQLNHRVTIVVQNKHQIHVVNTSQVMESCTGSSFHHHFLFSLPKSLSNVVIQQSQYNGRCVTSSPTSRCPFVHGQFPLGLVAWIDQYQALTYLSANKLILHIIVLKLVVAQQASSLFFSLTHHCLVMVCSNNPMVVTHKGTCPDIYSPMAIYHSSHLLGIVHGDIRLVCSCLAMETHRMKLPTNSSYADVASRGSLELGSMCCNCGQTIFTHFSTRRSRSVA
ncbi:EF-hand calcium-binding domain-containing protein 7-like [Tachypleus tridentatus]|uniref:EF-hand calcium-binding domain-containing protein 7-like n=1 Tax=Tachypleus tridentatus TaxID=6853 RepID=UPI003FD6B308